MDMDMDMDLVGLDPDELEYVIAEREGMNLFVCVECPDPALCYAERDCPRGEPRC